MTEPLYLVCMAKISISKKEGIIEKISYDRRAYESVDDRSHSYVISQKSTEKITRALMCKSRKNLVNVEEKYFMMLNKNDSLRNYVRSLFLFIFFFQ